MVDSLFNEGYDGHMMNAYELQAYNSLTYVAKELERGWCSGHRISPDGKKCLVGAVDHATKQMPREIRDIVIDKLAAELPPGKWKAFGRTYPLAALMTFNDTEGKQPVLDLVTRALSKDIPLSTPAEDTLVPSYA